MEAGPLVSEWFVEATKGFVPYLNITAHWDGAPDQDVLEKKGGNFFPYVIFMDADGLVLTDAFFPQEEKALTDALETATTENAFIEKYRKAAAAKAEDKAAAANLMLVLAFFQKADAPALEKLEEAVKTPGVADEVKERFAKYRIGALKAANMKKMEAFFMKANEMQEEGKTREEIMAYIAGEMYGLMKTGLSFEDGDQDGVNFYVFSLQGAVAAKDKANGMKAMAWINGFIDANVEEGRRAGLRERMELEKHQKALDEME